MSRSVVSVLALASVAGVASAQFSLMGGGSTGGGGGIFPAATNYAYDDGTADNAVGANGVTSDLAWWNVFATGADNQITSVELALGSPAFPGVSGLVGGEALQIAIYEDSNSNPADGATLLTVVNTTVSAGAIENNVFQTVAASANITQPFFWIGASVVINSTFVAAIDLSQPSLGRSWVNFGTAAGALSSAFENDAAGLPGVYLIRANAVPGPAGLGLLAAGGLAMARRRR